MPDVLTVAADLNTSTTAYEQLAYFALRPRIEYPRFADVKPTAQSHKGDEVLFDIMDNMVPVTTPLDESTDVDAVALSDDTATVVLNEYGNAAIASAFLRGTSFIEINPAFANVVGENAGRSYNRLARNELLTGANVRYSGAATARNEVTPADTLSANDVRRAYTDLTAANVSAWADMQLYYAAIIHPNTSYDLRSATGAGEWRTPREYVDPSDIWTGETGMFEGFRFIVTSEAEPFADAGSSTTLTDVYPSLFLGQQGLAMAWAMESGNGPEPRVILGPVTDHLMRFHPIGWYWFGGFGIFREAAVRRVESASSIGANDT